MRVGMLPPAGQNYDIVTLRTCRHNPSNPNDCEDTNNVEVVYALRCTCFFRTIIYIEPSFDRWPSALSDHIQQSLFASRNKLSSVRQAQKKSLAQRSGGSLTHHDQTTKIKDVCIETLSLPLDLFCKAPQCWAICECIQTRQSQSSSGFPNSARWLRRLATYHRGLCVIISGRNLPLSDVVSLRIQLNVKPNPTWTYPRAGKQAFPKSLVTKLFLKCYFGRLLAEK